MDLKEEEILGENIHGHWYYVSKGRAMRKFIGDVRSVEVLDVGAGSGIFSKQLIDEGVCHQVVCVDTNYAEEKVENYNGKQISYVRSVADTSSQLVLMMDVLEHVEDDVALLKDYVNKLEKGGYIFISVPAFQFMWSGHDIFLEHHRRYTIKMVEDVAIKAGVTPVKSRFFMASLFPALAPIRIFRKAMLDRNNALLPKSELKLYPNWLNSILIKIHDIERVTFFSMNKSFGLSVFCLCRKD